jgi:uncharacterized protein
MSAAQPKATEPSMEEILASIRRIISDDQPAKPATPPQPVAATPAPPAPAQPAPAPAAIVQPAVQPPLAAPARSDDDEDILDLTPKPRAERKKEPHFITDDPVDNDLSFQDPQAIVPTVVEPPKGQDDIDALMAAAEFDPAPAPMLPPAAAAAQERLVSSHTDRAVSTAFSSLANTVLANNGRTLDDVVTDMLRPMLKGWLDDNLPGIVERLVRAEIERVARGGR